jgi:hypothetical protein
MPINDEMAYRKLQRQLGEIQVALKLASGVLKDYPTLNELEIGVNSLFRAKNNLFQRILSLEKVG